MNKSNKWLYPVTALTAVSLILSSSLALVQQVQAFTLTGERTAAVQEKTEVQEEQKEENEKTEMLIRLYVFGTVQLSCEWIVGKYQTSPQLLAEVYELALPEPLRQYLY